MAMSNYLGMLIGLGFLVLLVIGVQRAMSQRLLLKAKRFEGRDHLSLQELHDRFYPSFALNEFESIWIEIAKSVEIDASLVRPTDRFKKELGSVKGYPLADEFIELDEAFEKRCREKGLKPENLEVETVDDYIRLFCKESP